MEFVEQGILSGEKLENFLHNLLDPYKDKDITGIVLGCTHYPFLKRHHPKRLSVHLSQFLMVDTELPKNCSAALPLLT